MRCRSESKSSVASLELSENINESDTNNVIDLREHKENNEGNKNENTGVGGVKLNLIQNKKTFLGCTDECIDQVTFNSQLENYIKEPCLKSLKILSLVEKQLQ